MIPVEPKPEPPIFDQKVRQPGRKYLEKIDYSVTGSKQWLNHDYWTHIRYELYDAYHRTCAYSAHWIPPASGTPNVDHFIPKSVNPGLAYEWNNYRLASQLANTFKNNYQDVLDPFTLSKDWFILNFPSLLIKPNPALFNQDQERVWATIKRIKLNDYEPFVEERNEWLRPYCLGLQAFSVLKRNAPFIAYELERQDLVEKIKTMMQYNKEDWELGF